MNSILKFHPTLTGWVDENIKNLKPLKQIMINITIYRSKPRLRIFLGKKKCATFAGNASHNFFSITNTNFCKFKIIITCIISYDWSILLKFHPTLTGWVDVSKSFLTLKYFPRLRRWKWLKIIKTVKPIKLI